MYSLKPILKTLIKQLALVFLCYQISRVLFFVFNYHAFSDLGITQFLLLCFYGLRFDAFSVAATNILYVLLFILPFKFHYHKIYQKGLLYLFVISNAIALALNFIDIAYFPYTQKRTTYDVGGLIFGGQSDFLKLIPHFITEFWYLILLYALVVFGIYKYAVFINKKERVIVLTSNAKNIAIAILVFVIMGALGVLGIRGGLQRAPIVLLDAAAYTTPKFFPLVINTPFAFLKSIELTEIQRLNYYDEATLKKIYSPIHYPSDTGHFKNLNVCVIILESFSKEYTGLSNRKSYTPFLDSLMSVSTVYTNAIANAKTSIDGIPAILSGLPCFLDDKYLNSRYSNNVIESLPSLLKTKGYYSAFFHGGTNGTMNFNSYAQLAGFDLYYGRTEYHNDDDFDGQWGIFDEPFLQQMVKEVNRFKQPFFVSVFTLSSHNPYVVPKQYEGKFDKGTLVIHPTIAYADYALKRFFAEAQKQAWFKNTLFVLSADHTGISEDPYYASNIGQHSIPIVFYQQEQTPQKIDYTVQQIDIMPTILEYLHFDTPYYAFGKSMSQYSTQPIIYYTSPNYNIVKDSVIYDVVNNQLTSKYNYQADSAQQHNTIDTDKPNSNLEFFKAYLQTYTNDLIDNKTHYHAK